MAKAREFTLAQQSQFRTPTSNGHFHYFIEEADVKNNLVTVTGWAFHERKRISQANALFSNSERTAEAQIHLGGARSDVAERWPFPAAFESGFSCSARSLTSDCTVTLRFVLEDGDLVELPIRIGRREQPRLSIGTLQRKYVAVRRVLNGLRYVARGDFRGLLRGIAQVLRGQSAALNRHDLAETMKFFRLSPSRAEPLQGETDIIVPVYNGAEFLPKLFDSIQRNTTSPYRLIVVDDCSTDPCVGPILEAAVNRNPDNLLLRNERNLGYVESVNRAVGRAQSHFVLLNTDIEVPNGWLERLMAPIVNLPAVASATPFTNAGTICSFPVMNEDNDLPGNLTVDQVDDAFRCVDTNRVSIEIPTGVGFCMAINRTAWRTVGGFDIAFSRGYAEENDWCLRAKKAGFVNVLVPNLFVYHKHGGSFGIAEKRSLTEHNLKRLHKRHPIYAKKVREFIKSEPTGSLRNFLIMLVNRAAARESPALVIDHQIGGGANVYRRQAVAQRLERGQPVLLLSPNARDHSSYHLDYLSTYGDAYFVAKDLSVLDEIFRYISVGEVFVNNLFGWPEPIEALAVVRKAKRTTGAGVTLAVHDYLALCPSYNLLNEGGKFCNLPVIADCRKCLPQNQFAHNPESVDIETWRKNWQELIADSDHVICFSRSSADLVKRVYELQPNKVLLQPHEMKLNFATKPEVRFDKGLHIGVVGGINYAKGAAIVAKMAEIIEREAAGTTLIVIGPFDGWLRGRHVTVTGPYKVEDLPSILTEFGVNICFLPSIWPETFSYVTSELLALDMPICCFDLGAPAERVRDYDKGLVISQIDAVVALDEIRRFFESLKKRFANSDTVARQQV